MNKHLNLGEVIELMKYGEVAVKVSGIEGKGRLASGKKYTYISAGLAIYFDETDNGILKNIENGSIVIFSKRFEDLEKDKFVIMEREVYQKINKM